jgi:hypothetical protein
LTIAARSVQVRGAFAKSNDPIKQAQLKEIVMDTSKVIELGNVSEETQGGGLYIESFVNSAPGDFVG